MPEALYAKHHYTEEELEHLRSRFPRASCATIAREFNSTVILYSGATRTLPVEVFAQVLQGDFASASVIGTVLIAVSLVPIVVLFRFLQKDESMLV